MGLFSWLDEALKEPVHTTKALPQKRTKKIVSEEVEMEVGITFVELTFDDGRTLTKSVYGYVVQNVFDGRDSGETDPYDFRYRKLERVIEPTASEAAVKNSLKAAEEFIRDRAYAEHHVDDDFEPKKSMAGKVVEARIVNTITHSTMWPIARVVDKEEND